MKNTKKGFTLVELLVVIAILAILASVAVVGYTAFINNAKDSKAKSELHQIVTYIDAELMDDGKWDVTVGEGDSAVVYTIKRTENGEFTVVAPTGAAAKTLVDLINAHFDVDGVVTLKTNTTGTLVYTLTDGGSAEETLR